MLGLGNTVLHSSVAPPPQVTIDDTTIVPFSTYEYMFMVFQYLGNDFPDTLAFFNTSDANHANAGDQQEGSISLKIERYDDLIANGGTVQATTVGDLYGYIPTGYISQNNVVVYLSDDNSSNIAASNWSANSGSALINLSTFGDSTVTASGNNHYAFTFTLSKSGYEDKVISVSDITINVS